MLFPWRAVWPESGGERELVMHFVDRQDDLEAVQQAFRDALSVVSADSLAAFEADGYVHELPPTGSAV